MTLSINRRLADQEIALRTMASEVGEAALFEKFWSVADPRFQDLALTTWVELQEKGLVVPRKIFGADAQYHLTEAGWIVGLRLGGTFDDPEFRARCVRLVKFFKHSVDGRSTTTDALISHHGLPAADLPFGWVLNALKSCLLQEVFPDKRMNASWDRVSKVIRVPVTFGMPLD